jgi:hypothetical protein
MVDTYGNYGAFPFAGVRATTAYTGIPATAAVPAAYPVAYGYPSFSATQYHAQDELGQASFGYAHPGQAASNLRDGFGNQIGSYAYVNPEGKEVRVSYTADSRGFHVKFQQLARRSRRQFGSTPPGPGHPRGGRCQGGIRR